MKTKSLIALTAWLTAAGPLLAETPLNCPLHPDEAKIVQKIIETVGVTPVELEFPGYLTGGIKQTLQGLGVDPSEVQFWSISNESKAAFIGFAYNKEGRTLAVSGNGSWLPNDILRAMAGMPELRSISMDHNGRFEDFPSFNGSGLEALIGSKLGAISIGLGFGNEGMAQLAKIASLETVVVGHSHVNGEGVALLRGHPGITTLRLAEFGKLDGSSLAIYATIPNLKVAGFGEAYITYENGFDHLKPLAGQLTKIDLSMSLFSEEDLAKLKADHPNAEIRTTTPEQIAKNHIGVAQMLVSKVPPELAAPLKQAIEALAAASK